jgi:hypothetical protein
MNDKYEDTIFDDGDLGAICNLSNQHFTINIFSSS